MRLLPTRRIVLALAALPIPSLALSLEPKGTFGFAATIDADGGFYPTLKSVRIQSVQPGMPAALAGVVAGDLVLEVEGTKVAGANASRMAERMKKKPGESVFLKLVRANGETYSVKLVAAAANN
jgi:C-terminal processing protease CtpA/Prc